MVDIDKLTCFYCDATERSFVRDHFVPRSLGGGDRSSNRVDACSTCDKLKDDLHPRDWLRLCPPQGVERVLARMRKLGLPLDDADRPRSRPGKVKTPPPRDGRSTSDGPGSWYGQPMPPPSWSRYAPPPAPPLPPGPVRSLREHAAAYLES